MVPGLVLGRREEPERRVTPAGVVEAFDVVEEGRPELGVRLEPTAVDELRLQRGEEALHRRVVVTVAAPAHRLLDAVPSQNLAVGLGSILHAAI